MILFKSETHFTLQKKRLRKEWITTIIQQEKKRVGEINYIFCDDAYLLNINKQYLNHDTYTDIITFDYSEEGLLSGDIFISIDRVKENAQLFLVDFHNELLRVLAHGVLHLCGYKDKTKKEELLMRQKEDAAIALFQK